MDSIDHTPKTGRNKQCQLDFSHRSGSVLDSGPRFLSFIEQPKPVCISRPALIQRYPTIHFVLTHKHEYGFPYYSGPTRSSCDGIRSVLVCCSLVKFTKRVLISFSATQINAKRTSSTSSRWATRLQ